MLPCKVVLHILTDRMEKKAEEYIGDDEVEEGVKVGGGLVKAVRFAND